MRTGSCRTCARSAAPTTNPYDERPYDDAEFEDFGEALAEAVEPRGGRHAA